MIGDQIANEHTEPVRVTLTGHGRADHALGIHDHERRPSASRVGLPGQQFGIVEDRVVHGIPLDRGGERNRIGLMLELG